MSLKLKALGLSVLAVAVASAFSMMSASATTGGHFTSEVAHVILTGTENPNTEHVTDLIVEKFTGINCTDTSYTATTPLQAKTVEALTVTPTYKKCETFGGKPDEVEWRMNGCDYVFTIGKSAEKEDNTVDIACPAGSVIEVDHPTCLIKIPPQNGLKGVSYTRVTELGVHALTVDVTISGVTVHFEGGACIIFGTKHTAQVLGSVTIRATNTTNEPVGFTATGSDGT
jgi:hypothetical protein